MKRSVPAGVIAWVLALTVAPATPGPPLVAAVLPASRSVPVGTPATAFATIINTGRSAATGCRLAPLTPLAATFAFQTTDGATNQPTGAPDAPVDIPAGAAQSFVLAITPSQPFGPVEVQIAFACDDAGPAPVVPGVNTLLLSAPAVPAPDVVALAATRNADGVVNLPEPLGAGAFALAAVNLGAGDTLTATAAAAPGVPVTVSLCRTDAATGACVAAPAAQVAARIERNATATYGVFAVRTSFVVFEPAAHRVFVRFTDSTGTLRGSASVAVRSLPAPTGGPVASGGAVLGTDGSRLLALNREAGSLAVVDLTRAAQVAEVALGPDPQTLAPSGDGGVLYATIGTPPALAVVDLARLAVSARIPVGLEPYGVVADPRGDLVYVASSALDVVEVVHVGLSRVIERIPVEARPKGLALSGDASRLYVTHFLTGRVSVVDTATRAVTGVIAAGADGNMAQKIALHPGEGRAYLPHIRSNTANRSLLFDTTVFPVVSAIDLSIPPGVAAERIDLALGGHPVNLPFDAAFAPDGRRLYVANLGSGDVSVVDLATRRKLADVDVGDGPRALAVSPDGRRAYVVNSLSGDVSVVDLTALTEITRIPLTPSPLAPVLKRGKLMFFTSRDGRLSTARWMSCASCHFEGEHDGRTWFFPPRGPRNTTSLRGAGDTGPLHWSADRDEVQDFELTIRELQGGTGLIEAGAPQDPLGPPNAGRSADLDALAAFVAYLQPKPSPFRSADGSLTAAAQRGEAIFGRADTGCAACHPAPRFTDSTMTPPFVTHDVGTGDGPDEGFGPAFDTPSLRQLWDSAPYLHDGSAPTLRDALTTRNPGDRHGRTSQLTGVEIDDLIAFLLSL